MAHGLNKLTDKPTTHSPYTRLREPATSCPLYANPEFLMFGLTSEFFQHESCAWAKCLPAYLLLDEMLQCLCVKVLQMHWTLRSTTSCNHGTGLHAARLRTAAERMSQVSRDRKGPKALAA
jgi:hypothetical protein